MHMDMSLGSDRVAIKSDSESNSSACVGGCGGGGGAGTPGAIGRPDGAGGYMARFESSTLSLFASGSSD